MPFKGSKEKKTQKTNQMHWSQRLMFRFSKSYQAYLPRKHLSLSVTYANHLITTMATKTITNILIQCMM